MHLQRICIVSGAFGVGKSEISMNIAVELGDSGEHVNLVDLDIVNPYFRPREHREALARHNVTVISTQEGLEMADLPALSPAIIGAIQGSDRCVIDVGGDPAGATALGRFRRAIQQQPHDFVLVVNANRPFSRAVDEVMETSKRIQSASGLQFTGIISNTHMMSSTSAQDIGRGVRLCESLSDAMGIPIIAVAVAEDSPVLDRGRDWMPIPCSLMLLRRFNDPDGPCVE